MRPPLFAPMLSINRIKGVKQHKFFMIQKECVERTGHGRDFIERHKIHGKLESAVYGDGPDDEEYVRPWRQL
jgi:hypothetical protein